MKQQKFHEAVTVKMEYAAPPQPLLPPPEEMRTLITAAEQHEQYEMTDVTERYPIIDPARPFVCQKCGVSFAREKALLSHSKVRASFIKYT